MRCVLYKQGCKARITIVDRQLTSPVPSHPTHDVQHAETRVHVAKQYLKKKADETDLPTKHMVAESVNGLGWETRAKLNCQLRSLGKMARSSQQAAHSHPSNSRSLEDLVLPPDYIRSNSGEPLLLWDSGYTTERRRSFLLGTPHNTSVLTNSDHFIIDGTFKSASQLMTQMVGVHGLFDNGWHMPLVYGCHALTLRYGSFWTAWRRNKIWRMWRSPRWWWRRILNLDQRNGESMTNAYRKSSPASMIILLLLTMLTVSATLCELNYLILIVVLCTLFYYIYHWCFEIGVSCLNQEVKINVIK